MIDEGFHLTPLDVRRYDFGGKSFRGYDPARVEEFRVQVAEELERLTRLVQQLEERTRGSHEQLQAFRERDQALNDALISAQQLRVEMREQAEREAKLLLREARAEGERLIEAAREEVHKLEANLAQLEQSRLMFIGQLRALVERQLVELSTAEGTTIRPIPDGEATPTRSAMKTPAWLDSLVKE